MSSDLETSHETGADDSMGSSQEEVIPLPCTPTIGGLSLTKKTPASEKRKKGAPDSGNAEAKRLRLEERAKRAAEKKQKEEEKQKRIEERRIQQEQRNEAKRKAEEEKQRQNEEKRKQLEEKKKVAEDEKRMKLEEKQKRDDEKRQKEDERLKKLEEKRKQAEEKQRQDDEKMRLQEEEKKRKERTSLQFKSFFKKVEASPSAKASEDRTTLAFLPFQLKPNQILAKVVPDFVKERFEIGCFDSLFQGQYESEELYLKELKSGMRQPIRAGMRVRKSAEDDVIVIDEESKKFKVKLLQFHTNTRPAWCGTWNKKSSNVTARRPFGRDDKWFDYEVDSDDEWEEEEAGESLAGSDNEGEPEDDYEIDNEFMVPHGYLSGEEEENAEEDAVDETNFREKEMIARKNMRVKQLKPVSIGCVWTHQVKQGQHEAANEYFSDYLKKYQIVFNKPKS